MNGKTRIKDIAEIAGVSPSTVSNVLNNRKGASAEITRRILELASELNYEVPSASDNRGHIRLVVSRKHGLVVMDTQFFADLIGGIEAECRTNRIDLMVTNIRMDDSIPSREQIKEICAENCTGIILLATELPIEDIQCFTGCRSPLMILDNSAPHLSVNTVAIHNKEAGYQAAKQLADAGHRHIGYIGSNPDFNNMGERRSGFLSFLEENGIGHNDKDDFYLTPTIDGAFADMDAILCEGKDKLPTAFFAANDILAIGAIRAMQQHGLKLPDDVSMIGMDDLELCKVVTPNLDSIRVPRDQMGRSAVQQLLQGNNWVLKTFVGIEPVKRESIRNISE
jgi:LacI family transcriptional regulator